MSRPSILTTWRIKRLRLTLPPWQRIGKVCNRKDGRLLAIQVGCFQVCPRSGTMPAVISQLELCHGEAKGVGSVDRA